MNTCTFLWNVLNKQAIQERGEKMTYNSGRERSILCKNRAVHFVYFFTFYVNSLFSQWFKQDSSTGSLRYVHLLCVMGNHHYCGNYFYTLWLPKLFSTKFIFKIFKSQKKIFLMAPDSILTLFKHTST